MAVVQLPVLNASGDLPPGVHRCSLAAALDRFGKSSARRQSIGSRLQRVLALLAGRADVARVIVFGNVLAVLRDGERVLDRTYEKAQEIKLPDERHGLMLVFRTFDRVSYALLLQVQQPVRAGDRFTQP